MKEWLTNLKEGGQKVKNTAKAVGPLLLAQSEEASKAWQRHCARGAEVDALREFLKGEVETRKKIREELLRRYIDASPAERVGIQRDLEFIDQIARQLRVVGKSLNYGQPSALPQGELHVEGEPAAKPTKEISDHWLDRFNALARQHNEDWREELLARALAREADNPGSVGVRVLWTIGNMDEWTFQAFSKILDLSIWITPEYAPFIPSMPIDVFDSELDNKGTTLRHLVYQLGDSGLIAATTVHKGFRTGVRYLLNYGNRSVSFTPKDFIEVSGIIPSVMGECLARFFTPTPSSLGAKTFSDWLSHFPKTEVDVSDL
jgi:Protein of unknown function (DUF2806)